MQKTAIITGASSGIGEATARYFAQQGWNVVLAARSEQKLQTMADELSHGPGRVLVVPTDVTQSADMDNLIQQTLEYFGRIDALINNAGAGIIGTVAEMEMSDLEQLFRLNVFAPVALLQRVVPAMQRQGHGVIVNISSMTENMALPFMSAYAASKVALGYLTDAARLELKQAGIDVVNVIPGQTRTAFYENYTESGGTGEYDLSQILAEMENTERGVPPERVAQTIWNAVRKRPRRTYVTLSDRLFGELVRRLPGLLHFLLSLALERYVPRKDQPETGASGTPLPDAMGD